MSGDRAAKPLTVTQLTRRVKRAVEGEFPSVWVVGETSNVTRAGSGHCYFTLKDDGAQLRAVLWKTAATRLRFDLRDGIEVVAFGRLEVYPPRGGYQLVAESLEPKGIGPLELAFRQLHEKLAAEGLFDPARKRPLPRFPRRIALVTSPTGAAVRDVLQVVTRRWPSANVVILPVPVQGDGAGPRIARAIEAVSLLPDVDVVVTGRGGGSLEDLWAFNDESLARAIVACPVPVVSAVGHEVDVSISDLVADRRALTPSEAGELVVPSREEVVAELRSFASRLVGRTRMQIDIARTAVERIAERSVLSRPAQRLDEHRQRLDDLEQRARRALSARLTTARSRIATTAAALDALSPLRVLDRGYTLTHRPDGTVIRDTGDLTIGDAIVTRFANGRITSRVEALDDETLPESTD